MESNGVSLTNFIFQKWLEKLLTVAKSPTTPMHPLAVDCLAILSSLSTINWEQATDAKALVNWIRSILHDNNEKNAKHFADEFLLYLVALCGTLAARVGIAKLMLVLTDDLIKLLNCKCP
jgi:hypothetical protein